MKRRSVPRSARPQSAKAVSPTTLHVNPLPLPQTLNERT